MRSANPAVIPRNHRVEAALNAAETDFDFTPFKALLAALEETLGEKWNDAVGTAWTSAYHLLRDAMCVAYHEEATE